MIRNIHRCALLDEQYKYGWIVPATRLLMLAIGAGLIWFGLCMTKSAEPVLVGVAAIVAALGSRRF